jgi:2-keto-4-pentenoate hydratase/2-oxohepta-3-ene-1,7-dioic acid hydratase in catechol pathway
MRLATVNYRGGLAAAVVKDGRVLALSERETGLSSVRTIAEIGHGGSRFIEALVDRYSPSAWRAVEETTLGPSIPDPGAIYTIGLNYRSLDERPGAGPERPLVYGKAHNAVSGHGAVLSWDRALTPNVDAEVELGVVVGAPAWQVPVEDAMRHVFGYTVINDVSSRDAWLDGDQWLLGKSMPGFCPVGPWIVTADEFDSTDVRLGCTIGGVAIQDGRTSDMRFPIADVIAYLSRHVRLEPGDLIATGTPARLDGPLGPDRHLEPGDVVTAWIAGIGELTTNIA